MDQWNGEQRAVVIKMFYMFGFFKSSSFLGLSCILKVLDSRFLTEGFDTFHRYHEANNRIKEPDINGVMSASVHIPPINHLLINLSFNSIQFNRL
jgi:hypothetical protein